MTTNDTRTVDMDSLETYFSPPLGETLNRRRQIIPQSPATAAPEAFGLDLDSPTSVSLFPANPAPHWPKGIAPRLKSMLAATLIDFVAFSPRPLQTKGIETAYLIGAIQRRRKATISVSDRLRIPRQRAMASSLFAPSGAYLSWLAMDLADGSDQ